MRYVPIVLLLLFPFFSYAAHTDHAAFIESGGIHDTTGSSANVSDAFATEAWVPAQVSQSSNAVDYTVAANATDTCWVIVSSDTDGISGWTREGSTAYYFLCEGDGTPTMQILPPDSAWLMRVDILSDDFSTITDLRASNGEGIVINVKDPLFGALGDGVTDDTAAIQLAVNALQSETLIGSEPTLWTHRTLYFPAGTYLLGSDVDFRDHSATNTRYGITILGQRGNREGPSVIFKAASGFSDAAMFDFADTSGTGSNGYYDFSGFKLDGSAISSLVGMRFDTLVSSTFVQVGAEEVKGAAFQFTGNTQSLVFDKISCETGNGDCLEFQGSSNNAIRVVNSRMAGNTGWGMQFFNRSAGLYVTGNTIESNDAGAIYLENAVGFTIDSNHFEGNGDTGNVYTTPSSTINSDIHLNGEATNQVTMERDGACQGGSISYNVFASSPADNNIFIVSAVGVEIEHNVGAVGSIVSSWGDTTYGYLEDVTVRYNGNDDVDLDSSAEDQVIDVLSGGFTANSYISPELMHTVDFGLPPINLMEAHNINGWIQVVSGGGYTLVRVDTDQLLRAPIFRLSNATTSDVVGVNITLADAVPFRGKWMYFGAWVSPNVTVNNNVGLYVEGTVGTYPANSTAGTTAYGTTRRFISMAFKVDNSETGLQVGIRRIGTSSGVIDISHPILALVGAPMHIMELPDPRVHDGSAVPSAGTWNTGDRVYNKSFAAHQPDYWVNRAGGAPGSWEAVIPTTVGDSPGSTCYVGALHIDTDETTDINCTTTNDNALCVCYATNTWAGQN